ncbi:unnamed protein product [Lactuca virosa]|uniref:RING-type E3 ubiquitin transferase n=1 Tax=Lactuca virosa TaxID=75947 RepID=A0AAU9NHI5_9ASTR|nr:unnamed protein product [Lactuca virosa]
MNEADETLNGVDWQLTVEEVADEGRTEAIDGGGRREAVLEGVWIMDENNTTIVDCETSLKMKKPKFGWDNRSFMVFVDSCLIEQKKAINPVPPLIKLGGKIYKNALRRKQVTALKKKQLTNKWENRKKEWKLYDRLMRLETGLGGTRSLVDASPEWWEEKIKPQSSNSQSKTVQDLGSARADHSVFYEDDGTMNSAKRAIPVVLTDPHNMCCPICFHPLCSPIYQRGQGHIACSSCCVKEKRKCPSCHLPIGFTRCQAMEKLVESLRVDCKNKWVGCKETLIYHKKSEHEKKCPNTPCVCPLSSCKFTSSSNIMYGHFRFHHKAYATSFTYDNIFLLGVQRNQKHIILQEQNEGVIFILNHGIHKHGRVFDVDCVGPSTFDDAFVYQLTVKYNKTVLSIESIPEVYSKWQQHAPYNNCLTIPSGFSEVFLQVCIKKAHPVVYVIVARNTLWSIAMLIRWTRVH